MESCCKNENIKNSGPSFCSKCHNKGIAVSSETLTSLVKEDILNQMKSKEGFYFCNSSECNVVYFNNDANYNISKEDIKIRVGLKEKESPKPVCYCFDWTEERILQQIEENGDTNAVEDITSKVKAGLCDCLHNNPKGRCCLGDVKEVIKRGKQSLLAGKKKASFMSFPIFGSIVATLAAQVCCTGPLILALAGMGTTGLFVKFHYLRPYLMALSLLLLGSAFYVVYIKKWGTTFVKTLLWLAVFVFIGSAYLPKILYFIKNNNTAVSSSDSSAVLKVSGMSCEGCEIHIETELKKLLGISYAKAYHKEGKVEVKYDKNKVNIQTIKQKIASSGYSAE